FSSSRIASLSISITLHLVSIQHVHGRACSLAHLKNPCFCSWTTFPDNFCPGSFVKLVGTSDRSCSIASVSISITLHLASILHVHGHACSLANPWVLLTD